MRKQCPWTRPPMLHHALLLQCIPLCNAVTHCWGSASGGASFQDRCLHLHNQSSGERFCPLDWSFPTDWTSMVLHLPDSKFCTGGNDCNGHLQCCEHCIRPVAGLLITVPRIPTNAFLLWCVQTIEAAACVKTPGNCCGAVNTTGREEAETGGG